MSVYGSCPHLKSLADFPHAHQRLPSISRLWCWNFKTSTERISRLMHTPFANIQQWPIVKVGSGFQGRRMRIPHRFKNRRRGLSSVLVDFILFSTRNPVSPWCWLPAPSRIWKELELPLRVCDLIKEARPPWGKWSLMSRQYRKPAW